MENFRSKILSVCTYIQFGGAFAFLIAAIAGIIGGAGIGVSLSYVGCFIIFPGLMIIFGYHQLERRARSWALSAGVAFTLFGLAVTFALEPLQAMLAPLPLGDGLILAAGILQITLPIAVWAAVGLPEAMAGLKGGGVKNASGAIAFFVLAVAFGAAASILIYASGLILVLESSAGIKRALWTVLAATPAVAGIAAGVKIIEEKSAALKMGRRK